MSDRTEEEEERFIRRNARRMNVSPERLLEALRPYGFFLAEAERRHGINQIVVVRPTPDCFGLFDHLSIHADISGQRASPWIWTALVPGMHSGNAGAVSPGGDLERKCRRELTCGTSKEARAAEDWIEQNVPTMFEELRQQTARFYDSTARARQAADEYLSAIAPSMNLDETFARLRELATEDQREHSTKLLSTQYLRPMNLEKFRVVWETCQLAQVLYWEHDHESLVGLNNVREQPAPLRVEAHRRLQICASRLAREAGWPIDDPLVPARRDELIDPAPWRDEKLDAVGAAIDDYLESRDARCRCGRLWRYVSHTISEDGSELDAAVRCGASHDGTMAINLAALQSGS